MNAITKQQCPNLFLLLVVTAVALPKVLFQIKKVVVTGRQIWTIRRVPCALYWPVTIAFSTIIIGNSV